nr:hypothetical protein [Desulfobacula sp.]
MGAGVTKEDHKGRRFFHQSIRLKIFLVSLLPTLALLYAAILNNQYLGDLGDSAELILSKNYKSIRAAQEVRKSLEDIRNRMLEQLSTQGRAPAISQETLDSLSFNLTVCKKMSRKPGRLKRSISSWTCTVLMKPQFFYWRRTHPAYGTAALFPIFSG